MTPRPLSGAISVALLLLTCSYCPAAGDPAWIHMRSPDFDVYSSADAGVTRDTLHHFEYVRNFFNQTLGAASSKGQPVYLVIFGSDKEFAHYHANEWSSGFYGRRGESDIIVLKDPSNQNRSVAVHEYFHLWSHRRHLDLPLWLDEGLAQLYSTLQPTLTGQMVGGAPASGGQYVWLPLRAVVSAREYPATDRNGEVGAFYHEAWALTHMLELSADYRAKAVKLLSTLDSGVSSEEALLQIYGKPFSAIEADVRAYAQDITVRTELYRVKLPKLPKPPPVEPPVDYDRRLLLVRLLDPVSKASEVRAELNALIALDPKRPEPHADLADLAFYLGNPAEIVAESRRALELGSLGPNGLWRYGRTLQARAPQEAAAIFSRLLQLDATRTDARLELARLQFAARHIADALETLAPIHQPPRDDAADYYQLLAELNLAAGREQEAAGFRDRVSPDLPHRTLEGLLLRSDCRERHDILSVRTAAGDRAFLVRDSGSITIQGREGEFAGIGCGTLIPSAPIRIEYGEPLHATPDIQGLVHSLQFLR